MSTDTTSLASSLTKPLPLLGLICLISLLAFLPSLQHEWINWDDERYVLGNRMVQDLSSENLQKIFTTEQFLGLYHPFTLLSYAIDYEIWGGNALGFHLSNLFLHLLNICLVFVFILRFTKNLFLAFLTALLFGIHPMHVEAVSWISARKELLYSSFFLLALLSYLKYLSSEKLTKSRLYLLTLLLFACSLLAKGTALILPFVLLLMDFWTNGTKRSQVSRALLEKIPFLILTALGLYLAYNGQAKAGALNDSYHLGTGLGIGAQNFWVYSFKALIPIQLSGFHPFPPELSLSWTHYLSLLAAIAALAGVIWKFSPNHLFFWGILCYAICLLPVLQIIPYGQTIISERYTYLPYMGLFLAISYGLSLIKEKWDGLPFRVILAAAIGMLLLLTVRYQKVWHDDVSFWSHVSESYPDHYYAFQDRGKEYIDRQEWEAAAADIEASLVRNPQNWESWYLQGIILEKNNKYPEANISYSKAIAAGGPTAPALLNRAIIQTRILRKPEVAIKDLNQAIQQNPSYALAYLNRGIVGKILGQNEQALEDYNQAIALEPWNSPFYINRARLLYAMGRLSEALGDLDEAIRLRPGQASSWFMRSEVHRAMKNSNFAKEDALQAAALGMELPAGYLAGLDSLGTP
jgi:tetratricopeptide (TPR) repeat protein